MKMARIPSWLLCSALALAVAFVAACDDEGEADPADDEGESEAADLPTYTARGEVRGLPDAAGEPIQIFHEDIPDFVDQEGQEEGMAAMLMPFGVAEDLALEGVDDGDIVEFTFEVDWGSDEITRVVDIETLPEDTELDLD